MLFFTMATNAFSQVYDYTFTPHIQCFFRHFAMPQSFLLFLCLTSTLHATRSFETRVFEGCQPHKMLDAQSKHFVIIITSYNNQQWYLKNITSACNQEYDNFEIIFTDDCSPDKTGDLVENFLENNPPACKITLIKNHTRSGALQNIYRTISWCKHDDIIVSLDGDDWLADNQVLSHLNNVYANKNVWMTHGQLQMYPGGDVCSWSQKMPADVVKNNSYRSHQNIPTHLRTFYVWLFRKIKIEDLLHEGAFFPVTWDMAFMIPMMELSGGNHAFISKVLYIYNETNPINDFKVNKPLQHALDLKVRSKKPYKAVKIPTPARRNNHTSKPIVLFVTSQDNPFDLETFIASVQEFVQPVDHICVAWSARSTKIESLYKEIIPSFPNVTFIRCTTPEEMHVRYVLLLRNLAQNHAYILTSGDTTPFTHTIDLKSCVQALENTQAYGFYFIAEPTPYEFQSIDINGQIKGWQFVHTPATWQQANPCAAILHKSSDAIHLLRLQNNTVADKKTPLLPRSMPEKVGLFLQA